MGVEETTVFLIVSILLGIGILGSVVGLVLFSSSSKWWEKFF